MSCTACISAMHKHPLQDTGTARVTLPQAQKGTDVAQLERTQGHRDKLPSRYLTSSSDAFWELNAGLVHPQQGTGEAPV